MQTIAVINSQVIQSHLNFEPNSLTITIPFLVSSLVHDVDASGHVCVGNEFELVFGHQFDVTSINMADIIHTMTDALMSTVLNWAGRRCHIHGLEIRADVYLLQGHRRKYVARI